MCAVGLLARDKRQSKMLNKPAGDNSLAEDRVHKVGTLWNTISNFGRYGDPDASSTDRPSMEWPGASRVCYLWEGRFWVGGTVGGEIRVSHADYGNYEFWPDPNEEFFMGPGKSIEDHRVVFDDLDPNWHDTKPLGIRVIERGLTWSTPDYDDFIAYEYTVINASAELSEGPHTIKNFFVSWVYDCDVGTVADVTDPHIDDLVDFDGWDGDATDTDIEDIVENIDINGNGVLDGYDEWGIPYGRRLLGRKEPQPNYDPSKIHPDGFWDEWSVILDKNGPPLRWQADVPSEGRIAGEIAVVNGDTLRGYCVPRNMSYMYDADNSATSKFDTGERDESFGPVDGFIGGALIYTDHEPYYTSTDDTLRRVYTHQWWNWESDPGSDLEKYQYMSATHPFSLFKFLPNPLDLGAPEFDYRWMTTTGPFGEFKPGEELHFVYVAAVGKGLMGLRQNVDNALKAYYAGSQHSNPYHPSAPEEDLHWVLPIPPPQPTLTYSPGYNSVELNWDNIAETAVDEMIGEVDFRGYKIYRAMYSPSNWQMIAAFDNVDEEVPVVTTEGDTLGWTNLPDITHHFVDQGGVFMGHEYERPLNGLPYYYVVVAYDPDKPAVGGRPALKSIESPRTNFMTDPETGAPVPVIPKGLYEIENNRIVPEQDLSKVTVFPNPYKGTSILEERYQEKIVFQNLPPACKISIFTITGDHIISIDHTDGTMQEEWNLVSRNRQSVKTGLYIYVVETEDAKKVGKFVILR